MELTKIVRAEESAEKAIQDAIRQKEEKIAHALAQRETRLASVSAPAKKTVSLKTSPPDLDSIRQKAQKNSDAAVRKILEEFHAAT